MLHLLIILCNFVFAFKHYSGQKMDSPVKEYTISLEEEKRYKQLINYLTDYIYTVWVENGRVRKTVHGPGCIAVTGYSLTDYEQDPELWLRMVHEHDRKAVGEQASLALAGKDVPPLEHRIVHRDGSTRWVRTTVVLRTDEQGKVYAYDGLISDITAQKLAERKLRSSEKKYRSLINDVLESSQVGISIIDGEGRYAWVNHAFEEYLGISRNDILGRDARSMVSQTLKSIFAHPDRFEQQVIRGYDSDRITENFEFYVNYGKKRKERWLEYWSQPIQAGLYAGGRIEHLADITEQKMMLETVVESELRHKQLLHHLTDYIYTVKVEKGHPLDTFHGPGCVAVTGYTQEDFAINPDLWIEMVYPPDRNQVKALAARALQGEEPLNLEHRIIHRDNTLRWVKSTVVVRKDKSGAVVSYDGLITDITERKQAEELASLRQQQLIQADKMATLGILVAGVAHEINNPNNFILLNTQLINRVWKDTEPILRDYYNEHGDFVVAGMPYSRAKNMVDELLSGIHKGSLRIQKIISSLKDFAKQDTGTLDQSVDINKVVEEAILIVNNLIKKRSQTFEVQYDPRIKPIRGNYQKLEQVIINLITNACQALKTGTKKLLVKTTFLDEKNQIEIVIEDSGIGIDSDDLKHIFDPFFTTKREEGGTGLGLSISFNIIKDHGGELYIESEPGQGTRARIRLPGQTEEAG
jgi:PAS domain S-box-containing protein